MKNKIASKQKKLFYGIVAGGLAAAVLLISFTGEEEKPIQVIEKKDEVDVISQEVNPETVRISSLEESNDTLHARLQSMEKMICVLWTYCKRPSANSCPNA